MHCFLSVSVFHSSSSDNDDEEGEQCFFTLLKGYFMEKDDLQCSTAEVLQLLLANFHTARLESL